MSRFFSRIFKRKLPVIMVSAGLLLLLAGLTAEPAVSLLMTESRRFERFTEEVFRAELSGNTVSLHYTVADPSAYNLEDLDVTLGKPDLESRREAYVTAENYLSSLRQFAPGKLTEKQQYTYAVFEDFLNTELLAGSLLLYDEPLSPTLGIQAQLPVLLAEYPFRTKKDIEDYLTLLSRLPEYFQSILSYENTKAANGLFMSDDCALEVIAQCQDFIADPEDNYLMEIFNDRIDAIANLSADEKIAFQNRCRQILLSYVVPAYQKLIDGLSSMLGSGVNAMGLYYFPQGTDYYEYLIRSKVGDDRPVEEIESAVKAQMVEDYAAIQNLLTSWQGSSGQSSDGGSDVSSGQSSDGGSDASSGQPTDGGSDASSAQSSDSGSDASDSTLNQAALAVETAASAMTDPETILNSLRQKITEDFPLLPNVSCEVKYVHDSLQEYLSPAFYLTPAIDDYENNVIYINPSGNYNALELFTTLAHEGYPGHLYQSVYFSHSSPDLLRNLLGPDGYVEGWATYVEMYAYGLWDKDPALAQLGQRNRSFMLGLASLLDIGIHYRGYAQEDVAVFMEKLGFQSDTSENLYRSILEAPANYLKYYVGYLNFCELRDYAQELMGENFSLKKYHTLVLDAGPAPFSILRSYLRQHAGSVS